MVKLGFALAGAFYLYTMRTGAEGLMLLHQQNVDLLSYLTPSRARFETWLDDGYLKVMLYGEMVFIIYAALSLVEWIGSRRKGRTKQEAESIRTASSTAMPRRVAPEGHGSYNPKLGGSAGSKY
jgi:hypothetical protein